MLPCFVPPNIFFARYRLNGSLKAFLKSRPPKPGFMRNLTGILPLDVARVSGCAVAAVATGARGVRETLAFLLSVFWGFRDAIFVRMKGRVAQWVGGYEIDYIWERGRKIAVNPGRYSRQFEIRVFRVDRISFPFVIQSNCTNTKTGTMLAYRPFNSVKEEQIPVGMLALF